MELFPYTEDQERLLRLIRIRWVAIVLIAGVVFFLKHVQGAAIPLLQPFLLIILAAILNTISAILGIYYKPFSEKRGYTYFRSSVDLVVITLMIHFTGGIESPFILLYFPEFVSAAMFATPLFAYLLAAQGTALYLFVCIFEFYMLIPHYHLSTPPSALFLRQNYIYSVNFALFFTSILIVYLTSYLFKKFMEKQKQIEDLSGAQVNFMNQVMHEIKSPLTSIIGYTHVLLGGTFTPVSKEQKEPLQVIQRQSQRILNMTNDLLDLARLESGKSKIEKVPASLSDVLERAIQEMKPQLDGKKLELIQEINPNLPLIPMDENKILQVVINLLSNAVKFSNPKGKIFISTQLTEKEVQVSVRDEGMGIRAEDLPHIFERFYRASKEASAVRGTGLGLALSKGIIEAHAGRLWAVSSGENKGAVFYFTLPL